MNRRQRGYLYKKSGAWYVRYSSPSSTAGKRVQLAHRLAAADGEYRTKTSARALADEFLKPLNDAEPGTSQTLQMFVEQTYLPAIAQQKRASTANGYRNLWKRYFASVAGVAGVGSIRLRECRTADIERILQAIAEKQQLRTSTLAHVKAFLSGVFRYAKRQGALSTENPVRDAVLPKAGSSRETHAYSLEEIAKMLAILPGPACTIVAVGAYTGLRKGEIRGICWENYDGHEIKVESAWWRDTVAEPKTARSKAAVPVIPQLRERLDRHRLSQICDIAGFELKGAIETRGLMFPGVRNVQSSALCVMFKNAKNDPNESKIGEKSTRIGLFPPLDLDALARDMIIPKLARAGLRWHGWHAFRRGLATNLHALGVQSKTIQRILRHSNVAVTEACYIKGTDEEMKRAMVLLASVSG